MSDQTIHDPGPLPRVDDGYQLVYADPPWAYDDKCHAGKRGAAYKYPCMSLNALEHMPVEDIAADNAVLAMWTTGPMIDNALWIMDCWDFEYKTVLFTWVKETKTGKDSFGLGRHTRSSTEFVLLGVRGYGLKRQSFSVRQVVHAPVGRHSAKPPCVRDRLVELYGPDVRRVELFARERTPGWDCWGNQVEGNE